MKKGCFILLFAFLLCSAAFAAQPDAETGLFEIPPAWQQTMDEAPLTAQEFRSMSLRDLWDFFSSQLKGTVQAPIRLAARLAGILVLAGVVKSLCSEKVLSGLGTSFDMIVAVSVFLLCSPLLLQMIQDLKASLENCRTYLAVFIPVFTSVMVSCGQAGTAAVYGGLFLGFANLIAALLCNFGVPILQLLLVLNACGIMETPVDFSALTRGIAKWGRWLLTFCATVFGTLLTLQSVFAQSTDTLALKTGKFLLSSSIPVVGKAVSDAMGSVLAGVKLLKGSVGFAAILIIALTFLPLIIKCVVSQFLFFIGEIIAGATGNATCGKLLRGMTAYLQLQLAMVVFFSFVVVSTTVLMILLGNGSA